MPRFRVTESVVYLVEARDADDAYALVENHPDDWCIGVVEREVESIEEEVTE